MGILFLRLEPVQFIVSLDQLGLEVGHLLLQRGQPGLLFVADALELLGPGLLELELLGPMLHIGVGRADRVLQNRFLLFESLNPPAQGIDLLRARRSPAIRAQRTVLGKIHQQRAQHAVPLRLVRPAECGSELRDHLGHPVSAGHQSPKCSE